ncbi:MAG: L,D-transpeptidase family protein [Planctomycetota bacterium]|jgi:lipoprotein-anchoring transpeptidase ErfK/SrfK
MSAKSPVSERKTPARLKSPPASQPAAKNKAQPSKSKVNIEIRAAELAKKRNDLTSARTHFNRALKAGLSAKETQRVRKELSDIAAKTIFSPKVYKDDGLVAHHVVRRGEVLAKIAKKYKVSDDLLADINNIKNKNFIREGQRLKVLNGPFHGCIDKSDHLMHMYIQDVYVRTFRVALGTHNSTPSGKWKVSNHQKNPGWTDPRPGGKRWHPDDPKNPIGEYWIGLHGIEGDAVGQFGYGIHGTIEPETIGRDVSLGCVRLTPKDIALLYKMMTTGHSLVTITD